jgi:hypothetical protein
MLQRTSKAVPAVCCPKAGNKDLTFRLLIYHTFVSVKQRHPGESGVRSGQQVINVPS